LFSCIFVGFNSEKSVEVLKNPELAGKPFGVRPLYSFGNHRLTPDGHNRLDVESSRRRLTRPENMVCGQAWQVYALKHPNFFTEPIPRLRRKETLS